MANEITIANLSVLYVLDDMQAVLCYNKLFINRCDIEKTVSLDR